MTLGTCNRPSQSFSDGIANELQLVDSYNSKMKYAKSVIGQIRNRTPVFSPIGVLPSEILVDVFRWVLCTHSCSVESSTPSTNSPHYPDALSQVCSRWRQIALSAGNLWTHIEVPLCQPRLLTRSELFVARAGPYPLSVHVFLKQKSTRIGKYSEAEVINFCTRIAPRMESLLLLIPSSFEKYSQSVLWSCITNCVPGTLTKFELCNRNYRDHGRFLEDIELGNRSGPQQQAIDIRIEEVLLHVKTLRLDRLYPFWTSKAYHGLAELHLHAYGGVWENSITKSDLVHILVSSPQLRIFHFSLEIRGQQPPPPTPISLKSLEVLDLSMMSYDRCETLLPWLSPGSNPMHISLGFLGSSSFPLFGEAFKEFNARSSITRLDLKGMNCLLPLRPLLGLLPKLRVLTLREFDLVKNDKEPFNLDVQPARRLPQLDTLYIRECHTPILELCWIAKAHSIHTITLCDGWIGLQTGNRVPVTKNLLETNISGFAPVVQVLTLEEARQTWQSQRFNVFSAG